MQKILILFSTTDGQTRKIAEQIVVNLQGRAETTLMNLDEYLAKPIKLDEFDTIILGASIRYGKHKASVTQFIDENQITLTKKTFAFFSVNLTARKPEKATPEGSRYIQKLYASIQIKPDIDAVFAGKLDYPSYSFFDRLIIRFIMKITGGPTEPNTVKEYTDWQKVTEFTQRLLQTH